MPQNWIASSTKKKEDLDETTKRRNWKGVTMMCGWERGEIANEEGTCKTTVFWDVAPCSLAEVYPHFRGDWLLPDYTVQIPRRPSSSYVPPWEPGNLPFPCVITGVCLAETAHIYVINCICIRKRSQESNILITTSGAILLTKRSSASNWDCSLAKLRANAKGDGNFFAAETRIRLLSALFFAYQPDIKTSEMEVEL